MDTLLRVRERAEEELLAEVSAARDRYDRCPDDRKAEALERYKQALERFDQLILWDRLPNE
jgi:hypothetical protein